MKILLTTLSLSLLRTASPCLADYVLTTEITADPIWFGIPTASGWHTELSLKPYPIGDFDEDGRLEVVSVGGSGLALAKIFDAVTGELEDEVALSQSEYLYPVATTIDSDPSPEILIFRPVSGAPPYYAVIDFVGTTAAPSSVEPAPASDTSVRPNPFNPSATIDYAVPHTGTSSLQVYDAAGRLVRTLLESKVEPGKQFVTWNGRDDTGRGLPSGTYFYSLSLDGQVLNKGKAVILK